MVDAAILQEWISKAEDDFQFARISLEESKPFSAHICFLFQQSAEKYLKAFILAQGLKFQKTHDLSVLLKKCLEKTPDIARLSRAPGRSLLYHFGLSVQPVESEAGSG